MINRADKTVISCAMFYSKKMFKQKYEMYILCFYEILSQIYIAVTLFFAEILHTKIYS